MSEPETKTTSLPREHVEFFVQVTLAAVIRSLLLWIPPVVSPSDRCSTRPANMLDAEFELVWHAGRILRELCLHLTHKPVEIPDCLLVANNFMGQIEKWIAAAVSDPEGVNARIGEAQAADMPAHEFVRHVYKNHPDIEAASAAFVEWMFARAAEPS